MLKHYPFAQEIYPQIWVGCQEAAKDREFLHNAGIKTIVNCTMDLPNYYEPYWVKEPTKDFKDEHCLKYIRVSCSDNGRKEEIDKFVSQTNLALEKNKMSKKPILIHCSAGQQRSCAFGVCFLWRYCDYSIDDAIKQIVGKRKGAFGGDGRNLRVNFADGIYKVCKCENDE